MFLQLQIEQYFFGFYSLGVSSCSRGFRLCASSSEGRVETSVVVALPPARRWSRHRQADHSKLGCRTGKENLMLGSNSGRFVLFVCVLAVCGAAGVCSADGVGGGQVGRLHGDHMWGGKSASRGRLNLVPLRYTPLLVHARGAGWRCIRGTVHCVCMRTYIPGGSPKCPYNT